MDFDVWCRIIDEIRSIKIKKSGFNKHKESQIKCIEILKSCFIQSKRCRKIRKSPSQNKELK
jgi:hypothetical protein